MKALSKHVPALFTSPYYWPTKDEVRWQIEGVERADRERLMLTRGERDLNYAELQRIKIVYQREGATWDELWRRYQARLRWRRQQQKEQQEQKRQRTCESCGVVFPTTAENIRHRESNHRCCCCDFSTCDQKQADEHMLLYGYRCHCGFRTHDRKLAREHRHKCKKPKPKPIMVPSNWSIGYWSTPKENAWQTRLTPDDVTARRSSRRRVVKNAV